jgi:hypothetical protein
MQAGAIEQIHISEAKETRRDEEKGKGGSIKCLKI